MALITAISKVILFKALVNNAFLTNKVSLQHYWCAEYETAWTLEILRLYREQLLKVYMQNTYMEAFCEF